MGKRKRRPKLRDSPLSKILLHAFLEYLSPRMEVDARFSKNFLIGFISYLDLLTLNLFRLTMVRVKRFRDICFWVRGSVHVPGETEHAHKMIKRVFKAYESEEHLLHRQVVMLLHYKV